MDMRLEFVLEEKGFVDEFNNKIFSCLDEDEKKFFKYIFPQIKGNSIIKCKNGNGHKINVVVSVDGKNKNLSFKKGTSSSMHIGYVKDLVLKLLSFGFSFNAVLGLLKYHFADGTIDGSGIQMYQGVELRYEFQDAIRAVAKELEKKKIRYDVTNYIVREEGKRMVDYVIYKDNKHSIYIVEASDLVAYLCKYKDELYHPYMRLGVFNYLAWGRDNSSTFERQRRKYYSFIKINNLKKYISQIK